MSECQGQLGTNLAKLYGGSHAVITVAIREPKHQQMVDQESPEHWSIYDTAS
ncbi:hypothetical protein ASPCADRAFT_212470 [Aspergillus carbonarius ITEM 5010]|uniref:Uncharacterized protein n=1 Tax=Aspergillus carbonarius (strain ITEM 5010) TaxID=602072 RepID=A0A1R3R5N4_ASPC5|nr:hypothetical protein ASPCADRAFT_212470 [Aspergillus carbonarius ITEM 5010]